VCSFKPPTVAQLYRHFPRAQCSLSDETAVRCYQRLPMELILEKDVIIPAQAVLAKMRNIAISVLAVVATLLTSEVALSGQRELASSPWFGKLFQSTLASRAEAREAELKALIEISGEQEPAWLEYILARRQYAEGVKDHRRQEYMRLAAGDMGSEITLSTLDADSPVQASKLALKEKFDALYATLNDAQKARADRELTPGECGK